MKAGGAVFQFRAWTCWPGVVALGPVELVLWSGETLPASLPFPTLSYIPNPTCQATLPTQSYLIQLHPTLDSSTILPCPTLSYPI